MLCMNGIARDIPVLLTHECSKSLANAIIERTIIWILASKLYFSCAAAAAGGFRSVSRHRRALARASFCRASLHVRRQRRRGSLSARRLHHYSRMLPQPRLAPPEGGLSPAQPWRTPFLCWRVIFQTDSGRNVAPMHLPNP